MRTLLTLFLLPLTAFASVVKTPSSCSPRPCVYVLDCAMTVCDGTENGELQTTLDDAERGDTVKLTNGKVWSGPGGAFQVTSVAGSSGYLTITSTSDLIPTDGSRVTPMHVGNMPTIEMVSASENASLIFPAGATRAAYVKFIGVNFTSADDLDYNDSSSLDLIRIGTGTITDYATDSPNFIEFERCYIHGSIPGEIRNGMQANGTNVTVKDSWISEIKMAHGVETHAVVAYDTSGPVTLINTHIESVTLGVLFGGDSQSQEINLSDCTMEGNLFYKPPKWYNLDPNFQGVTYTTKTMLEFKVCDGGDVHFNYMFNNYRTLSPDQSGAAMAINHRLPNGPEDPPWSWTRNIDITNNVVDRGIGFMSMLGADSNYDYSGNPVTNLTYSNNLAKHINCDWDANLCAGQSISMYRFNGPSDTVTIQHDTVDATTPPMGSYDTASIVFDDASSGPNVDWSFRNNLFPWFGYGLKGDSLAAGEATLNAKTSGTSYFTNSDVYGLTSTNFDMCSTITCSNLSFITESQWFDNYQEWVAPPTNYALETSSPYHNAGSDGADFGVDAPMLPDFGAVTITPGSCTAEMTFTVPTVIADGAIILQVSESSDLLSRVSMPASIPILDPTLFEHRDSSAHAAEFSLVGTTGTWVVGKNATEMGENGMDYDLCLTPNTTYYYFMTGYGAFAQGSFTTTSNGQRVFETGRSGESGRQ